MGPIWDAELRVWDAKNFGLVSPGTHRNKFVKKSLVPALIINILFEKFEQNEKRVREFLNISVVIGKSISTKKVTVNVLKLGTLVTCQKGFDKQGRPRSDCFLRPV